jgi:hypothetical protein
MQPRAAAAPPGEQLKPRQSLDGDGIRADAADVADEHVRTAPVQER